MSDQLAPNPVAVGRSQRPRVLGLVAAAVIPLLLLAAVSTWRGIAEAESRVADDRVAVARATALTADSLVAGQISALQNLAISGALADPIDGAALQGLVDRLLEANLNWDGLGLIGQDGWNIASALRGIETPIQPRTLNVADRPYFRQALTTGRPAVSPAVLGMVKNLPTVALAVPIDFESGGRGVFVVTLSLGKLEADLQTLAGRDGAGVILVDSSGQVFVHPNPAISRALTPLRGRADADAALAGRIGSSVVRGLNGVEVLSAFAPVPSAGWGVLVVQNTAGAFGPVRRDLATALAIFALAAALTGLIGWVLGGRLTRFYRRELEAMKQAEVASNALRESEARFRAIFESAAIGMSRVDATGRIVEINPALEAMLGYSQAELSGKWFYQITHPEDGGTSRAGYRDLIERRRDSYSMEKRYVRKDGSLFWGNTTVSAVRAPDGQLRFGIGLIQDISERKRAEAESARLFREAQDAIRTRDEFLSVASHELRTPLTTLSAHAQLILRLAGRAGTVDSTRVIQSLTSIYAQSERLNRLISRLLDISRLEAGKLTLECQAVDLAALVEGIVSAVRARTAQHAIEVTAPPSLPAVADPLRLEQVLTNLLDNAIKYSPNGGAIEVELSRAADDRAELAVRDHGVGIPVEKRSQIFERFYQAHAGGSYSGMGLGLYISRQIVELHRGELSVEFPPDGGTRFIVRLPTGLPAPAPVPAG